MILERPPVALQLSFGDPGPYADRIHASGALLICQVQTKAEAIKALWAGDALDLIHAIEPAGDVIATVIEDALRLLESAAAAVRSEARP